MWCVVDMVYNHSYNVSHVQKDFKIRAFIEWLLTNCHFFTKLPQILHTKIVISKV